MEEAARYTLDHATATVDLSVTPDRLTVRTQGKGALDKPRIVDIPLSDLRHFCVVPTIGAQHARTGGDFSYDSEFIFSYQDGGKVANKRQFVRREDEAFKAFLAVLERRRPDASLLHLEPAEAQQQMGVLSASKAVYIVIGLLVGIPLLVILITVLSSVLGR